jgi:hypothetical protein
VIGASFAIGSHASESKTQRVFQQLKAQSKRGKAPRKQTDRQKKIDTLIEQRQRTHPKHTPNAVADWILKEMGDARLAKTTVLNRMKAEQK